MWHCNAEKYWHNHFQNKSTTLSKNHRYILGHFLEHHPSFLNERIFFTKQWSLFLENVFRNVLQRLFWKTSSKTFLRTFLETVRNTKIDLAMFPSVKKSLKVNMQAFELSEAILPDTQPAVQGYKNWILYWLRISLGVRKKTWRKRNKSITPTFCSKF